MPTEVPRRFSPASFWTVFVLAGLLLGFGISAASNALIHRIPPELQFLSTLRDSNSGHLSQTYLDLLNEHHIRAGGVCYKPLVIGEGTLARRAEVLQVNRWLPAVLPLDASSGRTLDPDTAWRKGACEGLSVTSPIEPFQPRMIRVGSRSCEIVGVLGDRARESLFALGFRPEWVISFNDTEMAREHLYQTLLGLIDSRTPAAAIAAVDEEFRKRYPTAYWERATIAPVKLWIQDRWGHLVRLITASSLAFGLVAWAVVVVIGLAPLMRREVEFDIRRSLGATELSLGLLLGRESLKATLAAAVLAVVAVVSLGRLTGLQWLLSPAVAGVAGSAMFVGLLLWGARWAWVSNLARNESAVSRQGFQAGHARHSQRARWFFGALVAAQGAAMVLLVTEARNTASQWRRAAAARISGDLSGVAGFVAIREMQDNWVQGRTEAEARKRFERMMGADLRIMAGVIRPRSLDGRVGAMWPVNWEADLALEELDVPGSSLNRRERLARVRYVSGDAFQVLRLPIIAGQPCSAPENSSHPTAVVNRALVQRMFQGRQWNGASIGYPWESRRYRVVGIVGPPLHSPTAPSPIPEAYFCESTNGWVFLFRPKGDPMSEIGQLTSQLRQMFPTLDCRPTQPEKEIAASLAHLSVLGQILTFAASLSFGLLLLSQWASVSILLAGAQREVAIRLACGASIVKALIPTAAWVISVTFAALFLGLVAVSWWQPHTAADVVILASSGLLLSAASGFAVLLWRASRIPVAELLRRE